MTPEPPDNPRAFVHASGLVFQVVGFVLAMGTCCWWSFSDAADLPQLLVVRDGKPVNVLDQGPEAARTWTMLATCVSLIGGLALTALGIGLQHDLARSGRPAKLVTGGAALFFVANVVVAIAQFPGWGRIVTALAMTALWIVMFLLAGVSGETLKACPPPKRDSGWTSRDEDDLQNTSSHRPPGETSR